MAPTAPTVSTQTPKAPATPATANPVLQTIDAQEEAIRQGDYTVLGRLMILHAEQGDIELFKSGPLVATRNDRLELLITTEWPGLPDRVAVIREACKSCSTKCDQCLGSSRSLCTLCGGAGHRTQWVTCNCISNGELQPTTDCKDCRGSGRRRTEQECTHCDATGQERCPRCDGKGVRGTGKVGLPNGQAQPCGACQGQGWTIQTQQQSLDTFAHGRIAADTVAFGPLRGLVWAAVDGSTRIETCNVLPDREGNLMVLALRRSASNNARAYLVGGLPVIRARH